ncbi:uncharacterized protein K452DRAFT_262696 [Aplosporella prunicola CBS 121167]|uniref:Nop14-like protein n=1 Tax=Aplosporella prunicola CBS 121167 TaxID=1176127 RepID=A0A6A6BRG2_9PEZI|nr:uncharacterized protein K452DRAFT_262696 [Aplosporella prunicola CBS 121167]KAF2146676.1 hypothetical protein K452DRAFT_262696 [Aplosporella prunicola CBS 121167]
MPPSQLKRLKASLREQGITGPQKSKKEKKRQGHNADKRAQRNAALEGIRESFNPFEVKTASRPDKFESTSFQNARNKSAKNLVARPGVTKSLGEEARRKALLPEMNKRNKVGGIIDRRIGENDPTMTPEERMLERFTREKSRNKGASIFNLEEDEEEMQLTHAGQTLDLDGEQDDFDAGSLAGDDSGDEARPAKRRREPGEEGETDEEEGDQPERKKSKAEVMKEVIAKSKLHKFERQQAKEDDYELREELDQGLGDMLALLRGHKRPPPAAETSGAMGDMNPERAAMMSGEDKKKAEKEYDKRLLEMKLDRRAAPTTRTKTDEEKAADEAERLKELEEKRQRRMRGEEESEDEQPQQKSADVEMEDDEDALPDDAAEFGFTDTHNQHGTLRPPGIDDEDDFEIDADLVDSGSDVDENEYEDEDEENGSEAESSEDEDNMQHEEDEEDEFVRGILDKDEKKATPGVLDLTKAVDGTSKLAYTYKCPQSHEELLEVFKNVTVKDTPTVVQRIRALYHPQLNADNKAKMADFSGALVDHISYLALQKPSPPLATIETLIRHLHSLSRTFALGIATAFRRHLEKMHEEATITPGDLVILTAISTIYPTSDHFHQVVTPAITVMARWMGLGTPQTQQDLVTGAYLGALCLKYQALAKRYMPELVRFTLLALKHTELPADTKQAYVNNLTGMAELWTGKAAFIEIFTPEALGVLKDLKQIKALRQLQIQAKQARLARRPQELHHHRPQAIKTSVPKFEEGFNPDKHYDPDAARREASKLRAEVRREKKGAMRELRKDASFVARERLREKKERDAAYEAKYRKLVQEIQSEEGAQKNAYERERNARKGKKGGR